MKTLSLVWGSYALGFIQGRDPMNVLVLLIPILFTGYMLYVRIPQKRKTWI